MLRGVMKSLRLRMTCVAVTGATVVVVPLFAPKYVAADPIDDQRARVEQLTDQLEALERQADILAEDYVVAMDELRQLEKDVAAAEEAVAEQQAEVAESAGRAQRCRDPGVHGRRQRTASARSSPNSQSFNDELQRTELSRAALSTGTADSDDLERELDELADAQERARDAARRGRGEEGRGRRGPRGHRGPDRRVHRGPPATPKPSSVS